MAANHSYSEPPSRDQLEKGQAVQDLSSSPDQTEPSGIQKLKWGLVVFAIISATFLNSLDNTILADIQPVVVEHFNRPELVPWCSLAYVLAGTSLILVWGTCFAIFNGKMLFIGTIILFEIGSALCGAANTMEMFIVGRAVAGAGGTGMYVGITTLLSVNSTEKTRPLYMSLVGLAWAAGTILGPLVGGGFTDSSATWRWGFYINLVIGGVFAPIYLFMLPSYDPSPNQTLLSKFKRIDYLGSILSIGGFAAGIMAILFGGVLYPWDDVRIIAMLVLSGVLFITFFVTQEFAILTSTETRIFPMEFLKSRTMIFLGLLIAIASTALFVPVFYLPLFFQFAHGNSATKAAVGLLPMVCVGVFFLFLNGAIMSKNGYYSPWYFCGGILVTIGGALMYTVKLDTSISAVYGYTVIIGAGVGMYYQAGVSVAQVKAGKAKLAEATGYMAIMQWSGIVVALALSGAIFTNVGTHKLNTALPDLSSDEISNALAGSGSTVLLRLPQAQQISALQAILAAMAKVYILVVIAGALGVVMAPFLKFERIFLEHDAVTEQQ